MLSFERSCIITQGYLSVKRIFEKNCVFFRFFNLGETGRKSELFLSILPIELIMLSVLPPNENRLPIFIFCSFPLRAYR